MPGHHALILQRTRDLAVSLAALTPGDRVPAILENMDTYIVEEGAPPDGLGRIWESVQRGD